MHKHFKNLIKKTYNKYKKETSPKIRLRTKNVRQNMR